jgi:hypothetical protein
MGSLKFACTIGCHELGEFIRLNVANLRRVFGDEAPICLYDSPSTRNDEIKGVADEYGCAYFCERKNRLHFAGDIMAAVTAIAFAQHHHCQVGLKINQRTILLSPEIPALLTREFADTNVSLVTPARYPAESILDQSSAFHARFQQAVDVLAFRVEAWDAASVAERYRTQWTTGTSKYDTYSEVFWANESKRLGRAHRTADWLTAHVKGEPFKFLRKIQNRESDYCNAARAIGLPAAAYPTSEWSQLKPGAYSPAPKA